MSRGQFTKSKLIIIDTIVFVEEFNKSIIYYPSQYLRKQW